MAKDLDTIMIYDEIMAMMKPATAKDKRTTDNITNISNHAASFISKCETAIKTATPENAEKLFMELQKERNKTLNNMNDVFNEVSKELTNNRNKVMAAFQEVNNKLFKIYNK